VRGGLDGANPNHEISLRSAIMSAVVRRLAGILLDIDAGIYDLIERTTSASDAESSKPDPDIVHAALKKGKLEPQAALMLGDTPYDIEAAGRAGVPAIALRCGGWWDDAALKGAIGIYDDPAALRAGIDRSPLVCIPLSAGIHAAPD
jgi:phosphoglycolate phosphatase-like HAD superfamily hydrolase